MMPETMQSASAPALSPSWLSRLDNITDQLDVLLRLVSERMEDRELPITAIVPIARPGRVASNSPNMQLSSILHQLRRSTNECESSAAATQAVNVAHVANRGSPPMTGRYSSPGSHHGDPLLTPLSDRARRASIDVSAFISLDTYMVKRSHGPYVSAPDVIVDNLQMYSRCDLQQGFYI